MTTSKRDYYDVLGVSRSASEEDIRKAFRRLALEHHPDRNRSEGAAERFKEINEAYQVLSDADKRGRYDRFGHDAVSSNGGARGFEGFENFGGFGDIFDAFFGSTAGRGRSTAAQRGADLQHSVTIDFEEAVFGAEVELELHRTEVCDECRGTRSRPGASTARCVDCNGAGQVRRAHRSMFGQFVQVATCGKCRGDGKVVTDPCQQCRGSGRQRRNRKLAVTVPAGVEDGSQMRLSGEGEASPDGGPPGDVYVSIRVREHPVFERRDHDILYTRSVNVAQAALGAKVTVPTLEGDRELDIPPGTQSGRRFRLKGHGVARLRTRQRGDQLVTVVVETPTSLTSEQRHLLRQLSESLDDPRDSRDSDGKGWFDRFKNTIGNAE